MENKEQSFPEIKSIISFDDYLKLDIRLCLITSVEKVEGKDKLYKMEINTGIDKRTVISAIAHQIKPEQLKWRTLPFILNLAPRKIAGIESQAMIIMSEDSEKNLIQLSPNNGALGLGSSVI